MSDSRITQAVAEVSAAIELLNTARTSVHQLLDEDPAFTLPVQASLRMATRDLFRADVAATSARDALKHADGLENPAVDDLEPDCERFLKGYCHCRFECAR